jgi:hypothetical protein
MLPLNHYSYCLAEERASWTDLRIRCRDGYVASHRYCLEHCLDRLSYSYNAVFWVRIQKHQH